MLKKARKLLRQHACSSAGDDAIIALLQQAIDAAARSTTEKEVSAPVVHSLDLDLDDDAFVAAAAHAELGALMARRGNAADAVKHLQVYALSIFPDYIAARLELAKVGATIRQT